MTRAGLMIYYNDNSNRVTQCPRLPPFSGLGRSVYAMVTSYSINGDAISLIKTIDLQVPPDVVRQ